MERKITKLMYCIAISSTMLMACGSERAESGTEVEQKQKVLKVRPRSEQGPTSNSSLSGSNKEIEIVEKEEIEKKRYRPDYNKGKTAGNGGSGLSPKELLEFGEAIFSENGMPATEVVEDLKNYAAVDVELTTKGACGAQNCGKESFLVNSNLDRGVRVSVEAVWKLGDVYDGQLSEYEVAPGAEVLLGCSNYCAGKKNIPVKRKIIGAEYME